MILVTSGAARGDGFTCYAAVAGPGGGGLPPGGYLMRVFDPGRLSMAAEIILQGIPNMLSTWDIVICSATPP